MNDRHYETVAIEVTPGQQQFLEQIFEDDTFDPYGLGETTPEAVEILRSVYDALPAKAAG